jgi:hypothetical protein
MHLRTAVPVVCLLSLATIGAGLLAASPHGYSLGISGGHNRPVSDCSDLHIRFDDRDAVTRSEQRTVSKAEVPTFRVRSNTNGGVQVQGSDKEDYSVTACEAAGGAEAERILSQISLSVQHGEVSVKGPEDEDRWTVYLLIRAPRAAAIDLETVNGPLSLYSLEGSLTARAKNGPITLRDFSGEAEITATNGPIDIAGGSGNLRVRTENGPISVALAGTIWSGAGLSADAENGPLTLFVPSDYRSSFIVESTNHATVSCQAKVCENAKKTWDEQHRRIEFGNAPVLIRLSTVNGPVTVRQASGKL